jgi:hypothetical protein
MPIYFVTGCGDLEPEMQDTRTVILKMDFDQRSSLRTSSVSPAELSNYKTHLVIAQPSSEHFSSSYLYPKSLAEGLMDPVSRKITLEIPLNTQMKIFAFLFRENYSHSQLFSAKREVGYYGQSQSFTISTNTNSLSLGITLKADSSNEGDGHGHGTDTTELDGTWETACYAKADNTKSTIETLTFAGNALTSKVEDHSDTSCATDYSIEEWPFTFSIGDAVTFANGKTGHKFTLIVPSTYKITPQSALAVSTFNSESKCSASDWELNTEKECSNGDAGDTVYCLYQLDGNTGYPKCDSSSYPSTSDIQTDNASSTFVKQ